jgi:SAM-dependent methyltransferase
MLVALIRKQEGDTAPPSTELVVASFLLLFLELALIRWVTASAFIVAYFANIVLIGCFLGFGVGCAVKSRRPLFAGASSVLLLILLGCRLFEGERFGNPFAKTEFIYSASGSMGWTFALAGLYALIVLLFVCIGQMIGNAMNRFSPVRGYALNVFGSLMGTVGFALCSYFRATPFVWFLIVALLTLWLQRSHRAQMILSGLILAAGLLLVRDQQSRAFWSPYYKVQLNRMEPAASGSFQILVNNDQHQLALNLSEPWVSQSDFYRSWGAIYEFPYDTLGRAAKRVLVLGAGTGNDVAAALRAGASHVDAVELDPVILSMGKELHAERPYQDSRVTTHVNDARYFLRQDRNQYDVVILGWLDSHRLFSTMSNVRQDNFMYTVDSFRQIHSRLTDDGVLVLSFYVARPWVARKLFDMLAISFGHPPEVFNYPKGGYAEEGHIFVIGKDPSFAPKLSGGFKDITTLYASLLKSPVPSDDWPYLYYRDRTLSKDYVVVLTVLFVLSLLAVAFVLPRSFRSRPSDFSFFFLGAGFMLLETKNITKIALIFGSTWVTTSLVVIGVLLMILLSIAQLKSGFVPSEKWTWALLFGSLVLSALWQESWLPGGPLAKGILTVLVLSLTFGFANVIFIRLFSRVDQPGLALGLNLLGAVVGGLAEYGTLLVGINAMYFVVGLFYALSWVFVRWEKRLSLKSV